MTPGELMIKGDPKAYTQFENMLFWVSRLNRRAMEVPALPAFWNVLADELNGFFGCDRASLYLVEEGRLRTQFAVGIPKGVVLEMGQGVAGHAARSETTYLTNDPGQDKLFDSSIDKKTGYRTRNILASAFRHEGDLVGVVELFNKEGGFTPEDVRSLEWLAPHVGFVLSKLHAEEQRSRLRQQAQRSAKLAELGFLMSGLSHELGHPLTLLIGRAEMLLKKLPQDAPFRSDAEHLLKGARQALGIVQNFLQMARKEETKTGTVPMTSLLRDVIDLVDHQAMMNRVKLEVDVAQGLPPVEAARTQLQEVFLNLMVNALQAMPDGGTLTVAAETLGEFVVVRVKDTGQGIDAHDLPRLFEAFFTTRAAGGTGLGLALCKDIVEKAGGAITAASDGPGQGAEFTVRLPAGV